MSKYRLSLITPTRGILEVKYWRIKLNGHADVCKVNIQVQRQGINELDCDVSGDDENVFEFVKTLWLAGLMVGLR